MSGPAATRPAGGTVAGAPAARYPHLTPGQCRLPEAALLSGLASAARGRDCALAGTRPQPDGSPGISILIIGSAAEPCPAPCPAPGGFPPP